MNIPDNAVIWRDVQSVSLYHVGVKFPSGTYEWWFSLAPDAISECFGSEVYVRAGRIAIGGTAPLRDVLDPE